MSLIDSMTEEQQAETGERIARFLAEPLVEDLFTRLDARAYAEFLSAKTDPDRAAAQAKALALRELQQGLKGIVNTGTRARAALERS